RRGTREEEGRGRFERGSVGGGDGRQAGEHVRVEQDRARGGSGGKRGRRKRVGVAEIGVVGGPGPQSTGRGRHARGPALRLRLRRPGG
ncbi:unnamed protein product, partial [Scytosiphon promiscuus]